MVVDPVPPNQNANNPPNQKGANWPVLLGVLLLGLIALLCTFALMWISGKPEEAIPSQTGSAAQTNSPAPETQEPSPAGGDDQNAPTGETQPTAAGPVAIQVAGDTGTIGLLGQIVGVLGTIAAAAVGGIAGLLTGFRQGTNNEGGV